MMLNCYSNAVWGFLEGEINIKSKCEKLNKKKMLKMEILKIEILKMEVPYTGDPIF